MTRSKNEKGQAMLIVVLVMSLLLVGGMGLAIDGARLYNVMQLAQVSADSAATAAAMSIFQENNINDPSNPSYFSTSGSFTCSTTDTRLPCQYARKNGFGSSAADRVTVDFPTCVASGGSPQGSCGYAGRLATSLPSGAPNQVRVTIQRTLENSIIRMLGAGLNTPIQTSATASIIQVQVPTPIIITDYHNQNTLQMNGVDLLRVCGGPSQSIQVNSSNLNAYDPPSSGSIDLRWAGEADTLGDCTNGTGANFGINGGPTCTTCTGTVNSVQLGTTGTYIHRGPISDPYENVPTPSPVPGKAPAPIPNITATSTPNYGCTAPNFQGLTCTVYQPGLYGTCANCREIKPGKGFDFTGEKNIIFMPGVYYVKGGGVTFKSTNGGALPLKDPDQPNSNTNQYTGTICSGCIEDSDTGAGMLIFDTGKTDHNGDGFKINTLAYVSFQGPTKTQTVNGHTVPAPPYYGLTIWEDNLSENFVQHDLGAGNGCFRVQGTTYITPTLDIMKAHPGETKYQDVQYHGTPCGNTILRGDIVVSDLLMDGTSSIVMNLNPYGYLYTYYVALTDGGAHP